MAKYLNNISDCSLDIFSNVMESNDYKLLLLSGEYDKKEASLEWYKLYDEYNAAVKSKSVNLQYELTTQVEIQKNEYALIKNCLFLIITMHEINLINTEVEYDINQYIKVINNYGYNFDVKKGIAKEFERVSKQIKNYVTRIESDLKQIEKLEEDAGNWSFLDTIGVVEKHMGFQMGEKTTVKKFVTYLNQLISSQNGK